MEVRATKTAVCEPSFELLEASRNIQGIRCVSCNTWSEAGVGWHMIVVVNPSSGDTKKIWYCDPCMIAENRRPPKNTGYSLKDKEVPQEESPFKK